MQSSNDGNAGSSSAAREGLRGYVSHHAFRGLRIPANVQNLVLRDYVTRLGKMFKLSVNEYALPNCYVQLSGLLNQLRGVEGVVMCSLFMLPGDSEQRQQIYQAFLTNSASLHLVFESLVIATQQDVEQAEEILLLHQALAHAPGTIPSHLLPDLGGRDSFS